MVVAMEQYSDRRDVMSGLLEKTNGADHSVVVTQWRAASCAAVPMARRAEGRLPGLMLLIY